MQGLADEVNDVIAKLEEQYGLKQDTVPVSASIKRVTLLKTQKKKELESRAEDIKLEKPSTNSETEAPTIVVNGTDSTNPRNKTSTPNTAPPSGFPSPDTVVTAEAEELRKIAEEKKRLEMELKMLKEQRAKEEEERQKREERRRKRKEEREKEKKLKKSSSEKHRSSAEQRRKSEAEDGPDGSAQPVPSLNLSAVSLR